MSVIDSDFLYYVLVAIFAFTVGWIFGEQAAIAAWEKQQEREKRNEDRIWKMVDRVRAWRKAGCEVRIFTARMSAVGRPSSPGRSERRTSSLSRPCGRVDSVATL